MLQPAVSAVPYPIVRIQSLTNVFQNILSGPGKLYGYKVYNPNAVDVFVKISDTSSGAVGTAAVTTVIPIVANGAVDFQFNIPLGFDVQPRVYAVTGIADADATAPGTAVYTEFYVKT